MGGVMVMYEMKREEEEEIMMVLFDVAARAIGTVMPFEDVGIRVVLDSLDADETIIVVSLLTAWERDTDMVYSLLDVRP